MLKIIQILFGQKVIVNINTSHIKIHKDTQKVEADFKASFNYGFWKASASSSFKHQIEHINQSSKASNTTLKMKLATVQASRPWLNTSFMLLNNSSLTGVNKGRFSPGNIFTKSNDFWFQFLPTGFLMAKDVEVLCSFSDEEKTFCKEIWHSETEAEVSYLWFATGKAHAKYDKEVSDEEAKTYGANGKITMGKPGQAFILGTTNTALPYYPHNNSGSNTDETSIPITEDEVRSWLEHM